MCCPRSHATTQALAHTLHPPPAVLKVDEDQALALIKRGAVVVDVRLADDFRVSEGRGWLGRGRRAQCGLSLRPSARTVPPPPPHRSHCLTGLPPAAPAPSPPPRRRPPALQQQHIEGAISVPMFRLTAGNEKWDKVKRVGGCQRAGGRAGRGAGMQRPDSQARAQHENPVAR